MEGLPMFRKATAALAALIAIAGCTTVDPITGEREANRTANGAAPAIPAAITTTRPAAATCPMEYLLIDLSLEKRKTFLELRRARFLEDFKHCHFRCNQLARAVLDTLHARLVLRLLTRPYPVGYHPRFKPAFNGAQSGLHHAHVSLDARNEQLGLPCSLES